MQHNNFIFLMAGFSYIFINVFLLLKYRYPFPLIIIFYLLKQFSFYEFNLSKSFSQSLINEFRLNTANKNFDFYNFIL